MSFDDEDLDRILASTDYADADQRLQSSPTLEIGVVEKIRDNSVHKWDNSVFLYNDRIFRIIRKNPYTL